MILFFFFWNSYCTNISFYLVLKAKRIPAHNHPVIERLLTYRNVRAAFAYSQRRILWKQSKHFTYEFQIPTLTLFLVISCSSSMNLEQLMLGSVRSTVSFCLVRRNLTGVRCEWLFKKKGWVNFPVCILRCIFLPREVCIILNICVDRNLESLCLILKKTQTPTWMRRQPCASTERLRSRWN